MNNPDSQIIVGRFFEALDRLKADRKIRGIQTFTRRYDINRWNLQTLSGNYESNIFQPCWLTYLVQDYGVSASWLLLGVGDFYENEKEGD